jgi:peptidoglycan/LPS O-acetylase OafA/YrhL
MRYRREVDGLRALAVVPVIFFHGGFSAFSGGFVGVDVFFVISGYLITSIILVDLEASQFSLVRFYERRARRILPALFLVMGATSLFAYSWMMPDEFKNFGQSLLATANVLEQYSPSDYDRLLEPCR